MNLQNITIGIIGISSPVFGDELVGVQQAIAWLKNCGATLIIGKTVFSSYNNTTTNIKDRIFDLENIVQQEPDIILNITGGYNCNELLEFINWDVLQNSKTTFVGYSDITAFNLALIAKTNVPVITGAMLVDYMYDNTALERLLSSIITNNFGTKMPTKLWENSEKIKRTNKKLNYITAKNRTATGKSIIANLSTFNLMLDTEYMPNVTSAILFLEYDKEEQNCLPSIQRMLWQIRQNGIFKQITGLVFGVLEETVAIEETISYSIQTILTNATQGYDFPVIYNAPFGHIYPSWNLPNNKQVRINTTTLKKIFLDA